MRRDGEKRALAVAGGQRQAGQPDAMERLDMRFGIARRRGRLDQPDGEVGNRPDLAWQRAGPEPAHLRLPDDGGRRPQDEATRRDGQEKLVVADQAREPAVPRGMREQREGEPRLAGARFAEQENGAVAEDDARGMDIRRLGDARPAVSHPPEGSR